MDASTAAPVSNKRHTKDRARRDVTGELVRGTSIKKVANEGHVVVSNAMRIDTRTQVCGQGCHVECSADSLHPNRRRRCVSTTNGETKEPHGREEDHRAVSPTEETRARPHGVPDRAIRAPKQTASGIL
eukprot:2453471-Prymnesium_polylepis.1